MENYSAMDDTDRAILIELQRDSNISNVELARRINLSPPAVHARIRRLEEVGVIAGYVALINREAMGYDMLCFIQVSLQAHDPLSVASFRSAIEHMPEVLECHQLVGDIDYLMKVVIHNRRDLERFLMEQLTRLPGVVRVKTSIALTELKSTTVLPVPDRNEVNNGHSE